MIGVYWIQMAAIDSGMLAALLGITCRNILRIQKDAKRFEALSYLYNYHCLHSINRDIQNAERVKTTTITKTLAMTLDCVSHLRVLDPTRKLIYVTYRSVSVIGHPHDNIRQG